MSGDHHDAHPVPDEQRQAEAGLWPRRVSPAPSTPGEPRWECVVPMSVRFRTCTEARSHASCRTYNEHQRADARTPAPPAPLTRPDTDELRDCWSFGPEAEALCHAAADWIDAQPAPLTPTLPSTPVERPAAITDEMLRAAETHHGDSCSYCTSAGDIDCPTAAILDALASSPAPGDNP